MNIIRVLALWGLLLPALAQAGLVLENSLTEERVVQPGASLQGSIPLRNTGSRPLDQSQVMIPPGERIQIGYTLQVPHDAGLTGSYWSMIMIEPVAAGSPEALAPAPDQLRAQLTQVVRHGIQMVTHIADTGKRELSFDNMAITSAGGQRLLTVDVSNTGERWLRPQLSVELYDQQGRPVSKLDGSQLRIFPDTSVRYRVALNGVPAGQYTALILADAGGDDLFGTQIELNLRP